MAKAAGRDAVLSKNSVPIGGVRVSTLKFAGEPIDVTDRSSDGIIEVLSKAKSQQLTISVEGVYDEPTLRAIALTPATSKLMTDLTFKFADALTAADTVSGDFFLTSYEEGNPHDAEATFSAEFVSSGAWTLG